jgi:hypothetical protein
VRVESAGAGRDSGSSGRKEHHQRIDGVFWSRIMGVSVKRTFLTLKHTPSSSGRARE